jgi:cell division protease FtsH
MRRARREDRQVRQQDLIAEITRKPRSPDSVRRLTPKELHRVAVHEAGHALAACLASSKGAEISFVSVVPRSDGTLGFVASLPSERAFYTRAEYLEKLEIFLAGRAAEEIVFGTDGVSSGAGGSSRGSDLAVATRAAVELVTRYGLGPEGGLLWAENPDESQLEEADRLLREAYERVRQKLEERGDGLQAITKALVDRQEMTGEEVRRLVGD